jgi:hypothetical protein
MKQTRATNWRNWKGHLEKNSIDRTMPDQNKKFDKSKGSIYLITSLSLAATTEPTPFQFGSLAAKVLRYTHVHESLFLSLVPIKIEGWSNTQVVDELV